MSKNLTEEKVAKIHEAQSIAEERFGEPTTTQINLWDDGDFIVTVIHGVEEGREKIIYRSSESKLYEGKEFMYVKDEVTGLEENRVIEKRVIDEGEK